MLEKYCEKADLIKLLFLCILDILILIILFDVVLTKYIDKNFILIDLLFKASEPALIIAILGIIAATEVTAYTVMFAIVSISSSVRAKTVSDKSDSASLSKSLTAIILLPSTAKITIIALILLIVSLYSQDTLPNIVWLILLGLLVIFTISEIWKSSNSVYYILICCLPDHELNFELQKIKFRCNRRSIRNYPLRQYKVYHMKRAQYPEIFKRINNYSEYNGKLHQSYLENSALNYLNQKFTEELMKSIPSSDIIKENGTLLHLLRTSHHKKYLKELNPKNPNPVEITKICLDLMYRDTKSLKSEYYYPIPDKRTLEVCLVLLYKQIITLKKKYKWINLSYKHLYYINPNETHMYMIYGYVLYGLGTYEDAGSEQAREYYHAAIDAYECANIADPGNILALDNKRFIEMNFFNQEYRYREE